MWNFTSLSTVCPVLRLCARTLKMDGTYALAARYTSELLGGKMVLTVDGSDQQVVEFEKTPLWKCKWIEDIALDKGRHTIRLALRSGRVDLNWLYLD